MGIRELFDAAEQMEGAARRELLDQAEPELRLAVEELLAVDQGSHTILDQPLVLPLPRERKLPEATVVGRYRVVREIGWGGMGSVYLAELAEGPAGPQFAIKIVRFPSPELARRLAEETRILSRLDHPNIARLIDTGTTEDGLPYLAMEYVDGQPIDRDCASRPTAEIVARLRQVCAAVRYLHQNLVVHRDLKPANILVTASGVVKVVDFGIAKVIDPAALDAKGLTLGPLTPEYASPEQVQGGPLSTLSDVFTLGLVSYELLAGEKPFGGTGIEVLHKIANEDAAPPSSKNSRVARDLDAIVLRAMEREPSRRYASVEQMDEDLRRFEQGLPVMARAGSGWYRLRKFVARNRAAVAGSVAATILLAAGLLATTYESRRTEQQRQRAEAEAKSALAAQLRAESSEAEALRQKTDAERRLKQLEQVAEGALRAYRGMLEPSAANSQAMADHVREVLLLLGREGVAEGDKGRLLDNAEAELRSRELAVRGDWELPDGWDGEGSRTAYRVGRDRVFQFQGKPTVYMRSLTPDAGGASLSQTFRADRYRGKRVRFSAMVRPEKVEVSAWIGVSLDQMTRRVFTALGSSGWVPGTVVLDVPEEAETITLSVKLVGPGTLWASNFDFREVDPSTPTGESSSPRNLNFTR